MRLGRGGLAAAALVLAVAGTATTLAGWYARDHPSPPAAGANPPVGGGSAAAPPLSHAAPVQLDIPAIAVHARVIPLGLNSDGTVAVPSLSTPQLTSWYDGGPAPGQTGAAALYGHVDTARTGPAVFFRLDDLRPGDTVTVTRADHATARFRVYGTASYPKAAFPTQTVYGPTRGPELRLITCGGAFDQRDHSYLDNVVVFARLVEGGPRRSAAR